jgi:hypothetical protein
MDIKVDREYIAASCSSGFKLANPIGPSRPWQKQTTTG